jgi:hypothetical protein
MDVQLNKRTVAVVVELLQSLMPGIVDHFQKTSPLGSTVRAMQALDTLRTSPKSVETTDQLMVLTYQVCSEGDVNFVLFHLADCNPGFSRGCI